MPEADRSRPGHVGHTPQPVSEIIRASRIAGVLSSSQLAQTAAGARRYVSNALPRLVAPEREHTITTALRISRWRDRLDARQPWPFNFREGFAPGRGPGRRR